MKNADVQVLLRQILQASLAAPLAFAACGGQAGGDVAAGSPALDAATSDASSDSAGGSDARADEGPSASDAARGADSANATDTGIVDASATDASATDASATDASGDAADVHVPSGCSTTGSAPVLCDAASGCGGACQTFGFPLLGDPAVCGLVARSGPLACGSSNSAALCAALCHSSAACFLDQTTDENRVTCQIGICCTGRRPEGLALDAAQGTHLGRWFAEVAALEAASVDAFAVLRDELRAHGAPGRLLRAAARAQRDEVRHARVTGALARRYGSRPGKPRVQRGAVRSIEAIARENAVEGCVRETFGALVGMWQARVARDHRVREAMNRIASDEARHAALSWDIARWAEARLDAEARGRVDRAREAAVAELEAQVDREPALELVREAGLPSAVAARVLLREARRRLWS